MCVCLWWWWCVSECACTLHRRIPCSYMDYPLSGPILDSFASSPCHRFFLFPSFPLLSPFVQVRFSLLVTPQNVYIKKRHESSLLAPESDKQISPRPLSSILFPLRTTSGPLIVSEKARVGNSGPFVYFIDYADTRADQGLK